jgi:hypothetical protein
VQGTHEQRLELLSQRIRADQVGHRVDHRLGSAEPQLQLTPAHGGVEPSPVQGRAYLVDPVAGEPGERGVRPQTQCLGQRRGTVDIGQAGVVSTVDQPGEPMQVDRVRVGGQDVAGISPDDFEITGGREQPAYSTQV